jgi:hypothetical protein
MAFAMLSTIERNTSTPSRKLAHGLRSTVAEQSANEMLALSTTLLSAIFESWLLLRESKKMEIKQAYKYELMPNGEQARSIRRFAGSTRYVYNHALALQQEM